MPVCCRVLWGMALLACGVCAHRACCMCGHGRAPEYSRCRPHVLVGSCVDLGFCVHRARGSHGSGGQYVCGVPCVCRSLCVCTVPVHRCVLRVCGCASGGRGLEWVNVPVCSGSSIRVGDPSCMLGPGYLWESECAGLGLSRCGGGHSALTGPQALPRPRLGAALKVSPASPASPNS